MKAEVWQAVITFFGGVGIGWLLATIGYGRALQRVARLYREGVAADISNVRARLACLEDAESGRRGLVTRGYSGNKRP